MERYGRGILNEVYSKAHSQKFKVSNTYDKRRELYPGYGGASLWKMLFPFFYWLLRNRVYKVNDQEIAEELTAPTVKEKAGSSQFIWMIVASIMASTLSPLINYFDVDIPIYVNAIIVTVIVLLMTSLIFTLSRMLKKS